MKLNERLEKVRTVCRDGSYTASGSRLRLENVTVEDSGYYYCTAKDPDGVVRAASIHVQVREIVN